VVTIRPKKQAITDGQEVDLESIPTHGFNISRVGRAELHTRVASCLHMRRQETQAAAAGALSSGERIKLQSDENFSAMSDKGHSVNCAEEWSTNLHREGYRIR
jgi:hypothetical protein